MKVTYITKYYLHTVKFSLSKVLSLNAKAFWKDSSKLTLFSIAQSLHISPLPTSNCLKIAFYKPPNSPNTPSSSKIIF